MADAAMMRTVSDLTRRRKANRLQDGIDRYVPISQQDRWTITRSRTKLSGPRPPTASAVDRCKCLRSGTTPCRPRLRAQSKALMEVRSGSTVRADAATGGNGQTLRGRGSAQKRCQPLVKCDGNCSEMPVKTW